MGLSQPSVQGCKASVHSEHDVRPANAYWAASLGRSTVPGANATVTRPARQRPALLARWGHPQRDAFQQALTAAGIGNLIHYPVPPHLSGAYAEVGWPRGAFPIAEQLADSVLSLPIGPHLTRDQANLVIQAAERESSRLAPA